MILDWVSYYLQWALLVSIVLSTLAFIGAAMLEWRIRSNEEKDDE